jgi:hypothetical protein
VAIEQQAVAVLAGSQTLQDARRIEHIGVHQ